MANSPESETTELVKQLLERLAISTAREDQAAAISTLQTQGSETRAAAESLKADHDESTIQQSFLKDQNDKRFNEVFTQLAAIQALNEKIEDLNREKEELIAIVRSVIRDAFSEVLLRALDLFSFLFLPALSFYYYLVLFTLSTFVFPTCLDILLISVQHRQE